MEDNGLDLAAFLGDAMASPMSGDAVVCSSEDNTFNNILDD